MNKSLKAIFYTCLSFVSFLLLRGVYTRLLVPRSPLGNRARKEYRRAIERWENEGGAPVEPFQTAEAEKEHGKLAWSLAIRDPSIAER